MSDLYEQHFAYCIESIVRSHSFKRIELHPILEGVDLIAAWRYKTLNMNRGIALVTLPDATQIHPGEVARSIKKPIGKAIGYIPLIHELGLQLILLGRGVLARAGDLHSFLDTANTGGVILQSIHVVDDDPKELIEAPLVRTPQSRENLGLPPWAERLQWLHDLLPIRLIPRALGMAPPPLYEPMSARRRHSTATGRAAVSVRTFGQTRTGPFIDAIETGIDQFLESPRIRSHRTLES